jgi:hypothetical protein
MTRRDWTGGREEGRADTHTHAHTQRYEQEVSKAPEMYTRADAEDGRLDEARTTAGQIKGSRRYKSVPAISGV